jgi:hypothetical protein
VAREGVPKAGAEAAFYLWPAVGTAACLRVGAGERAPKARSEAALGGLAHGLLVEAAQERKARKETVAEEDLAEPAAGPFLLVEGCLELLAREQPALHQQLAERTPVGIVIGVGKRIGQRNPLPRLSARIGPVVIPRRG